MTSLDKKLRTLVTAEKKRSLEDFMQSDDTNAYIHHNGLKSYVRKGYHMIDGEPKHTLDRANTTNTKDRGRYSNVETANKPKSTGRYKALDDHMHEQAKKHGLDGVYVESVMNKFLPKKLEQYGYKKVEDKFDYGGAPNYYKPCK